MEVYPNYSLRNLNTFHIDASARWFAGFSSEDQLQDLLDMRLSARYFVLGGGSNILLTRDYDGLVMKNEIKGIEILKEDDHHVYVRAGAGESWHGFVQFCTERSLAGAENLSLIPGSVGAAPMQNIGAYGVELKDVFHDLEAFHFQERHTRIFTNADCRFGYRESVFKNAYKNQFCILNVTFRLNKHPTYHTAYGAIEQELERMQTGVSIQSVARAVINIRTSKLPDPTTTGNAGSFFKNPVIPSAHFTELKKEYPEIPGFPLEDGSVKVAAGWLIEKCGWKGLRKGDAGCHALQALVLVNYGNASGRQILELATEIGNSVNQKFKIQLETEVNIID